MKTPESKRRERLLTKKNSRATSMKHHVPKQTPEQATTFEKMVASAVDTGDKNLSAREGLQLTDQEQRRYDRFTWKAGDITIISEGGKNKKFVTIPYESYIPKNKRKRG